MFGSAISENSGRLERQPSWRKLHGVRGAFAVPGRKGENTPGEGLE